MKTTNAFCLLLISLVTTAAVRAVADEDDVADQEDVVKSLIFNDWHDFMEKGKLELVLRPQYEFFRDGGESEHEAEVVLELETFPGENWELELELETFKYIDDEDDSEFDLGDIELGVEYRLLHLFDPVFDLRVGADFKQPLSSAADGVTDGLRKYGPYVSARWKLHDFHMFSRVGYTFVDRDSGDGDANDIIEYQLDGFYPLNQWRLGFELYGESNDIDDGDETELFFAPEIRWRHDDLELGLGTPFGLTGDSADFGVAFQLYLGFDIREGKVSDREHNVFGGRKRATR